MIRETELKPGLALHIMDTHVENKLTVPYECDISPVIFGFFFSGKGENHVSNDAGKQLSFTGEQGDCGISYFPRSSGVCEFPAQSRLQLLHISIAPFLFDELMTGGREKIAPDFHPVLHQESTGHYYKKTMLSTPLQMALAQLLDCPFHGTTRRIYLESKAMELVALQLETLVFDKSSGAGTKPPDRSETDRIYEAREIILNRYLNPPSLGELSRQVGLNEFKLKKGFQKVFGNTVFGCLFDHRMEQARLHVEERKKSVKEIAHAVGYQSTSRFSDAFKRKFGTRPTHYHS
ncbi:MAG: helix-turn-helix transcriptional regulator [Desulfobacteraceae bacterium]|nr:helix-turn-helix transcriptional regulator [Desulfobacteraceae bacterium]